MKKKQMNEFLGFGGKNKSYNLSELSDGKAVEILTNGDKFFIFNKKGQLYYTSKNAGLSYSYSSLPDETEDGKVNKRGYVEFVKSHGFYIRIKQIFTPKDKNGNYILKSGEKIKLDLYINKKFEKYYSGLNLENVVKSVKETTFDEINSKIYNSPSIMDCLDDENNEDVKKVHTVHNHMDKEELEEILEDNSIKEFNYETKDGQTYKIVKKDENLYIKISDEDEERLCDIDENGLLKVLFK